MLWSALVCLDWGQIWPNNRAAGTRSLVLECQICVGYGLFRAINGAKVEEYGNN